MGATRERMSRVEYLDAKGRKAPRECSICRAYPASCEQEHFPMLREHGGSEVWPICLVCHDKADRYKLEDWDASEVWSSVAGLWSKADTAERILLVKMLKIVARASDQTGQLAPPRVRNPEPTQLPSYALPIIGPEHTCALPPPEPEGCGHDHSPGDPWLWSLATHSIRPTMA